MSQEYFLRAPRFLVHIRCETVTASRYGVRMATSGLEVTFHQGRERAQVMRFTHTLDEVVRSLREIDQVYLARAARATWVLASLDQKSNRLVVRLEASNVPNGRGVADMLVPAEAFVEGAETLAQVATVPRLFRPHTVTRMAHLAVPKSGVQTVSVAMYNGTRGPSVELSDLVHDNATRAVQPFSISYGTVTGRVFGVREVRKGRVRLSIRDERNQTAIEGEMTEKLAETARESWRHRFILGGKIRRNGRGQAIRMDVDRLEPMPEDNSGRPTTESLLGAGASWFENESVDDAIAKMRND
ncbi:hypothetical protein [Gordonia terrae]|uniref:hypothetical protein n=2 Tax=Gordonia TaxID=2053 RepID=UPI003394161F